MTEQKKSYVRQPAIRVALIEVAKATFTQGTDMQPSVLTLLDGKKVGRCNIVAVVLSKREQPSHFAYLIDDGTGTLMVRSFEKKEQVEVGDPVRIIGKVRSYQNELYLVPEIMKKTDPLWLKVRAQQREKEIKIAQEHVIEINAPQEDVLVEEEIEENLSKQDIIQEMLGEEDLPFEKISKIIAEIDTGDGALIEEVLERIPFEDKQDLLQKMMQNGDIFENQPGKIKIL